MRADQKNKVAWIRTERRQDGRHVVFLLNIIQEQEAQIRDLEKQLAAHKAAIFGMRMEDLRDHKHLGGK